MAVTESEAVLVVDVGSSSVRAGVVRPDASVGHVRQAPLATSSPGPGLSELDAAHLAAAVVELATSVLADVGPVAGVGIATQRASALVWDRRTGMPLAPAIGWQDLRTVLTCLTLQGEGIRLAPNMSATKIAAILDEIDPDRERAAAGELCAGTIDSWVAWTLAGGSGDGGGSGGGPDGGGLGPLHVTDATNAAVTGMLVSGDAGRWDVWDERVLGALGIPEALLPDVVDSCGRIGEAVALPGAPPICALIGDQQASLIGQGCTRPGLAKATFGTGGMLDLCDGPEPPSRAARGEAGTFPVVAWRREGRLTWGTEAIMLTAGACVDWLREDLELVASAEETETVAASCESTGDVWFVPALMGMGTPVWDFGARGALVGLTRGTGRPEIVRAVLEGVAHRGADLLEAAESDAATAVASLRVDGGMSANRVFVQALADACGRPVELSRELEATTVGAGLLAAVAIGALGGTDEIADAYLPRAIVEPRLSADAHRAWRDRWLEARERAARTIPDLSGIEF
ncbi:MAG TPA: FGGY-family carbohydrate kinase [Acidimicrobiales bacterium]|nr:FGGY-family carbohydrate kinase [Acidimicrobiales bacterium]